MEEKAVRGTGWLLPAHRNLTLLALSCEQISVGPELLSTKDLERQQWYSNKDVREAVRPCKALQTCAEANKDNKT
uniref:Uncharacterized protein n=1 Tax=Knipowitschia caucasica TaxID=637954 RepID=A0AAV2M6K8_KNICA